MNRLRAAAAALALLVFAVNPGFGCGEDFTFGETEMRRAVEGTYDLSLPGDTTPRATFTLKFGNSDLSAVQQAHCSNRTFVASASACSPSSSMSLVGSVVAGSPAYQGKKIDGYFNAYGYDYRGGFLQVVFDLGGPRVSARVTETNELVDVTFTDMAAPQQATLIRRPQ